MTEKALKSVEAPPSLLAGKLHNSRIRKSYTRYHFAVFIMMIVTLALIPFFFREPGSSSIRNIDRNYIIGSVEKSGTKVMSELDSFVHWFFFSSSSDFHPYVQA